MSLNLNPDLDSSLSQGRKRLRAIFFALAIVLVLVLLIAVWHDRKPRSAKERMGYVIGLRVAESLKQQNVPLDARSLGLAVGDVLDGAPVRLDPKEQEESFRLYQESIEKFLSAEAEKNLQDAESFLKTNSGRSGVERISDWLQIEVLRKGTGAVVSAGETVRIHLRGTLMNGFEFESTRKSGRPLETKTDRVLPGLAQALPLMRAGGLYRVFLHPKLAYGESPRPGIGPNSLLIFEVEVPGR